MKSFNIALLLFFVFPFQSPIRESQPKLNENEPESGKIVFKSTDGGQNWKDISEGLPGDKLEGSLFVNDQGFFLRSGNYIYHNKPDNKAPFWEKEIFPDNHSNIAPGKSGMYAYDYHLGEFKQKMNGSKEWSSVYRNFHLKGIIDVFETTRGTVFIVCDRGRGLFRSTDDGKSWKEVTRGVWKLVESNGVLMANNVNGIIRSTDDGQNWETVLNEGGVGIDIAPIDGGFAAITFNTQSETRRVRTSSDGGKTWQAIDAGLPPSMMTSSIVQAGKYFLCGHPNGIYRSGDKSKTWQLILPSIDNKIFRISVSGNVVYAIPGAGGC